MKYTKHYTNDRQAREAVIQAIGEGKVIDRITVDYHGRTQVHEITDNAIIRCTDANTNELITKLIARPNQIRRYYPNGYSKAIAEAIKKAYEHQLQGLNEM